MSIRATIVLLLTLITVAFIAGLLAVRRFEVQKFAGVVAVRESGWAGSVADFLERQRAPLAKMVEHLASAEGTLPAVLGSDTMWATEAWDDRTLTSFGANAVFVLRANGSLFFTHANTAGNALQFPPIPADALPKLFARQKIAHFYILLPAEVDGGLRLLEIRGVPIRPSWDTEGTTRPEGYFFGGRIWDEETLRELPLLSDDDRVALVRPELDPVPRASGSVMKFAENLQDWQGHDLARLIVTNESPALAALEVRGDRLFTILVAGGLVLLALLFALLSRAVVRPLQTVIRGLNKGDLALLEPLRKQRAEFGELARLIHLFFEQRATLDREMKERIASESALRLSEEMLQHSQKMEAVGRLAGGVAHDFNNLLTAIIGYADLLSRRLTNQPEAQQEARLIHQAGEQAAGLTRQLLAFSRKQLLQPKIIDLNAIIRNLHRLLQRIIGEHIEIRTEPNADAAFVKADAGQIEQVIVNLGVNARDAMPRGGRLTIRTKVERLDEDAAQLELAPGEYVVIEVEDTGEGMNAETKGRIFEPFFTTKGPGKGTGLGLATVYGIVRQSGGSIAVESAPGHGSTFRVFLPRRRETPETLETVHAPVRRSTAAETVLVVEDEEIVRELVCEVLRSEGYRVLGTDRGSEAVRLLQAEKREVHLLISDVIMPEMNGGVVAQRVRAISPTVKVLFVSGYSENDMVDQGMDALDFEVLQKPFTPDALTLKVRAILDGESTNAQPISG